MTIGSALLTIGITLPVALYFQMQSNSEAFKILNTCNSVGINSIFISRKRDSKAIRDAIDESARESMTVTLLGIAFGSFFHPSSEYTEDVRDRLYSPPVHLRVLLLNPDSDAAKRRADAEEGNATIDDIRYSLNNSLVSAFQERLRRLLAYQQSIKDDFSKEETNFSEILRSNIQVEVRIYNTEPVVFLMIFDNTMFAEQYHRGRPEEIVPVGSCIGKYMPLIQYRRGSPGFRFLESHFERVWGEASDVTNEILQKAIARERLRPGQTRQGIGGAT
jgi:hypothetical protein